MKAARLRASLLGLGAALCLACGCSSTGESASKDKLTADVGRYQPPPRALGDDKPTVGVPNFEVKNTSGVKSAHNLDSLAADQMTTLLHLTGRFDVVERSQIEKILDEQNMEGIVRPDQMAKAGQAMGAQYILSGKVTNFRVKQAQTKSGVDVGGIGGMIGGNKFGAGSTGFDQKKQILKTECGVDIRLVDSTTSKVVVAHFGEFTRTDTAGALGISVFGMGGSSDAEVSIEEDDAGKILRLAFDDALKKMLPEIDQKILAKQKGRPEANAGRTRTVAAPPPEAADAPEADAGEPEEETPTPPARNNAAAPKSGAPAAAQKFCGECGAKIETAAKFCPKCGAKAS